jgi:glucan phosphoethanolaminetransferase (alkaline phosphatase superfamily)
MKYAFQVVIVVSIAVSLAAISGFAWSFLGYSVAGAFGSVLKTPQDAAAKEQLFLWGVCSLVALALTCWLFLVYRQQFKRKLK